MISEIIIWGKTIPMYGVLGVTGALLGILYILLMAPKFGADREKRRLYLCSWRRWGNGRRKIAFYFS